MSTDFIKMPQEDTRSRRELIFSGIQLSLGDAAPTPCDCAMLTDKDLIYNWVEALNGSTPPPEMGNRYIPPAATVGDELFTASLPINWTEASGNYHAVAPLTAGLSYRLVLTYSNSLIDGARLLVREQDGSGNDTGLQADHLHNVNPAGTRVVHEFVAGASTTLLSLDIFNMNGDAKTVQITEFSVMQIEEVTPYIVLSTSEGFDPTVPTGAVHIDNPVVRQDGSTIRGRVAFGTQSELIYGFDPCPVTFMESAYANYDAALVVGPNMNFSLSNNDHILSIIRPPETAPVITGGDDVDDLIGNIHGQEVIRTPLADNFQLWYDPLGDGNWIQRTTTTNQYKMRCKKVKIILNTLLTDMDDVDIIESDHVFIITAGGGIQCDRTDRFIEEVTISDYFYWMSSLAPELTHKGRFGTGTTVQDELDFLGGSGGVEETNGYAASWAVLRRNIDNLCFGLSWSLANENAQPGATGFRTRLRYDPFNLASKINTFLEFDAPVPADTEFTSTLWAFLYDPADTTEFHEEMAALGGEGE